MSKRPPPSGLHQSRRKTWGGIYDAPRSSDDEDEYDDAAARLSEEEDEDVYKGAGDPEDGATYPEDRAAVPDEGAVDAPVFALSPLRSPLGTVADLGVVIHGGPINSYTAGSGRPPPSWRRNDNNCSFGDCSQTLRRNDCPFDDCSQSPPVIRFDFDVSGNNARSGNGSDSDTNSEMYNGTVMPETQADNPSDTNSDMSIGTVIPETQLVTAYERITSNIRRELGGRDIDACMFPDIDTDHERWIRNRPCSLSGGFLVHMNFR
jgi:hypothetical protein